jgi:hypothetical protein
MPAHAHAYIDVHHIFNEIALGRAERGFACRSIAASFQMGANYNAFE